MAVVICNEVGGVGIGVAVRTLAAGAPALEAVEQGIRPVEADPDIHSVGRGGWPSLLGEVELDASIMDGRTLRSGSVGALRGYLHPISVARQVMERLPHVLLVGEGAARFAAECGATPAENLTPEARRYWEAWWTRSTGRVPGPGEPLVLAGLCRQAADPERTHGTTVFLALDDQGTLAAGVSTSGWAMKYPGRLGDSPVIGAGAYADDRYGAAACIGQGELTIRAGTARSVVLYLKMGLGLEDAVHEAVRDLQHMRADLLSFVMVHALSPAGDHCAMAWGERPEPRYWAWRTGDDSPVLIPAPLVP